MHEAKVKNIIQYTKQMWIQIETFREANYLSTNNNKFWIFF